MNARKTMAELAQWVARWQPDLPELAAREFAIIVANGGHPDEIATGPDGQICWTPRGLALVLGLVEEDTEREWKSALARLEKWRRGRKGPRFLKVASSVQAAILYVVGDVSAWISELQAQRSSDLDIRNVDFRRTAIATADAAREVA